MPGEMINSDFFGAKELEDGSPKESNIKIWLINPFDSLPGEFFRPGRYATLVDILISKGFNVTWWSSNFFHATKSYRKKLSQQSRLRIFLIPTPSYTKNVGLKRVWNHYVYARRFESFSRRVKERPDIIVASCPPLFSAKFSIKIAKKLGVVSVIDVQDLWPESFEMIFPSVIGRIFLWPLKKFSDSIYDSADALISVSQTYLKRVLSVCEDKSKPSLVLHLGIDLTLFDNYYKKRSSYRFKKRENEFLVTYIGTVGKSYDIETIIRCAKSLMGSHPPIRFFIAGEGPELLKIKRIAAGNNLTNCEFTGWLNFDKVVSLLKQSDVGLNAIVYKSKTTLPNKIFDYLAAGLPIISSLRGEFENLLKTENIGLQYIAGDRDSLKEAILYMYNHPEERKIMGENARKLVEERFNRRKTYLEIAKFLKDLVKLG